MNRSEKGQTGILFLLLMGLLAAGAGGAYVATQETKGNTQALSAEQAQVSSAHETIKVQADAISNMSETTKAEAEALLENAKTISGMAEQQSKLASEQLAQAQTREEALTAREARVNTALLVVLFLFVVVAGSLMGVVFWQWNRLRKPQPLAVFNPTRLQPGESVQVPMWISQLAKVESERGK